MARWRRLLSSRPRPNFDVFTPRTVRPEAPPLLLIHGFACGREDWGAVPKIVATKSQRPVISFDNRGVGEMPPPPGPYTCNDMAHDAMCVLDRAGFDRAAVMGISLGGMIAQTLALDHPERVCSLILGCTTHGGREAHPPDAEFMRLCAAWAGEEAPNASSEHVDAFMRAMLPRAFLDERSGALLSAWPPRLRALW